jgi:hypothetical protein
MKALYSTYQKFGNAREKLVFGLCKKPIFAAFPKIGFLTEGIEFYLEVSIMVGYFLNFFQIFKAKGKDS